jgi:hypothetical protein
MAAHQGGYLLSPATRRSRPIAVALDLALDSIEAGGRAAIARPRRGADAVQAQAATT